MSKLRFLFVRKCILLISFGVSDHLVFHNPIICLLPGAGEQPRTEEPVHVQLGPVRIRREPPDRLEPVHGRPQEAGRRCQGGEHGQRRRRIRPASSGLWPASPASDRREPQARARLSPRLVQLPAFLVQGPCCFHGGSQPDFC